VTITGTEAYEAMRTHHQVLSEQLTSRAAAVGEAVTAGRPHQAAVASLLDYLAGEVLPHAAAEEDTIYPAAALHSGLIGTVNEMLAEHNSLSAAAEALTGLADGAAATGQATQIAELFTTHAAAAVSVRGRARWTVHLAVPGSRAAGMASEDRAGAGGQAGARRPGPAGR
jgi:Hemerythrin HHE cation binding domain